MCDIVVSNWFGQTKMVDVTLTGESPGQIIGTMSKIRRSKFSLVKGFAWEQVMQLCTSKPERLEFIKLVTDINVISQLLWLENACPCDGKTKDRISRITQMRAIVVNKSCNECKLTCNLHCNNAIKHIDVSET